VVARMVEGKGHRRKVEGAHFPLPAVVMHLHSIGKTSSTQPSSPCLGVLAGKVEGKGHRGKTHTLIVQRRKEQSFVGALAPVLPFVELVSSAAHPHSVLQLCTKHTNTQLHAHEHTCAHKSTHTQHPHTRAHTQPAGAEFFQRFPRLHTFLRAQLEEAVGVLEADSVQAAVAHAGPAPPAPAAAAPPPAAAEAAAGASAGAPAPALARGLPNVHPSLYPVLILLSRLRAGPPRQVRLPPPSARTWCA